MYIVILFCRYFFAYIFLCTVIRQRRNILVHCERPERGDGRLFRIVFDWSRRRVWTRPGRVGSGGVGGGKGDTINSRRAYNFERYARYTAVNN